MEHQSAGGQLAPGFAGLHLEFESLTIADHLRRDVSAGAASPGVSDLPAHAARQRGWDGDGPTPTAAESLLALIQEAVGLEVRLRPVFSQALCLRVRGLRPQMRMHGRSFCTPRRHC